MASVPSLVELSLNAHRDRDRDRSQRPPVPEPVGTLGPCVTVLSRQMGGTCYFMAARAMAHVAFVKLASGSGVLPSGATLDEATREFVFRGVLDPDDAAFGRCLYLDPKSAVPESILTMYRVLWFVENATGVPSTPEEAEAGMLVQGIFGAVSLLPARYIHSSDLSLLLLARAGAAHLTVQGSRYASWNAKAFEQLRDAPAIQRGGNAALLFLSIMLTSNLPFYLYTGFHSVGSQPRIGDWRVLTLKPSPPFIIEVFRPEVGRWPLANLDKYIDGLVRSSGNTYWPNRTLAGVLLHFGGIGPGMMDEGEHAVVIVPCQGGYAVCDSTATTCQYTYAEYMAYAQQTFNSTELSVSETLVVWLTGASSV